MREPREKPNKPTYSPQFNGLFNGSRYGWAWLHEKRFATDWFSNETVTNGNHGGFYPWFSPKTIPDSANSWMNSSALRRSRSAVTCCRNDPTNFQLLFCLGMCTKKKCFFFSKHRGNTMEMSPMSPWKFHHVPASGGSFCLRPEGWVPRFVGMSLVKGYPFHRVNA